MKKFIYRLQAKPRYNGCRLAVKKEIPAYLKRGVSEEEVSCFASL